MTHEERLAALLREEAETVVPTGDGLARISGRLRARRRSRWLLLPGAAALTAGAVAAAFVLSGGGSGTTLTQTPTTHGPTPAATPTVAGGGLDHAFENPALWPFTSAQELGRWRSTHPYANDKAALVQHYLHDVLKLSGFTLSKPCESCDVVDISVGGHQAGTAALERFLLDGTQVWTISSIGGTDLTVTSPTPGEAVAAPATVTGRITGVDEHVDLALVTQAGAAVATGGAQAGSAVPWNATLTWTDTSWSHAALVARTFSAKDGTLNRLTAVPVTRGDSAAAPTFAAVRNGRVDLFDANTGAFIRHLTYPPAGYADTRADYGDGDLVWIRSSTTGCRSAVYELRQGHAVTLAVAGTYSFSDVRVSSDRTTVAYLRSPCSSPLHHEVVVKGSSNWQTTIGSRMPYLFDVSDGGRALFVDGGVTYLGDKNGRTALVPGRGCAFGPGYLIDPVANVWRSCGGGGYGLVTFRADGSVGSHGPPAFANVADVSHSAQGMLAQASLRRGEPVGVYRLESRGGGLAWIAILSDGSVTSASW